MKKATFTKMTDGTQDDYTPIVEAAMVHSENLPDRIIEHLNMLKDDFGGFAVCAHQEILPDGVRSVHKHFCRWKFDTVSRNKLVRRQILAPRDHIVQPLNLHLQVSHGAAVCECALPNYLDGAIFEE